MRKINHLMILLVSLLASTLLHAQGNADTMRSNGRIYVVIAVVLAILTGMILYLVRLDRKIRKIEKES
jgi:hypothetical protein